MFSVKSLVFAAAVATAASAADTRYGTISLEPTTLSNGTYFHFTYDSTTAEVSPYRVDLYIQGTQPDGTQTPLINVFSGGNNAVPNSTFLSTETTPDLVTLGFGDVKEWNLVSKVWYDSGIKVQWPNSPEIVPVDLVGQPPLAPFTYTA